MWLHQRWAFKPWHWFILYGFVGYLNEWLAFDEAASVFSIPFWIIIYGSIVYLPTYFFMPIHHRQPLRWYRVLLAVMLPFVVAIPWALMVMTMLHQ